MSNQENKNSKITIAHASFILAILPFVGRFLRRGQEISKTVAQYWVYGSSALAFVAVVLGIIVIYKKALLKEERKGIGYAIAGILIGGFQLMAYVVTFFLIVLKN